MRAMDQRDMPTMRSRRLGAELRRLRIEAGLKVQEIAEVLECGQPKVSQIENGKRGIRPLDLTVLLKHYGVDDERQCASLRRLAKEIHKVDWWSNQGPLVDDNLRDYLTLEADSELVCSYESVVIPGLLQTEAYMRQTFAVHPPERVEVLVETRMKRKELLDNRTGFRLRAVIDVPALHRLGRSAEVVREQLEQLQKDAERSNVNIQVLPLGAALPVDVYPPFTIFRQRGEPPADVVWLEHITGGNLLEQRRDVQRYSKAWDELTAAALPPADSQQYIRDLL
ncbi:helix-turn-helix transcriptional regulator [Streptomyces iranensis]|uniref:Transcriptional regulatory protein n=2 Tax=Streptomyces iranensis TaxID=576784 RepID=A0A060ZW36_9ACTN|nr:transcriptional regulatory protein [Streptomyces iranensis]